MLNINIIRRHTQFSSDDLRKCSFMSLPLCLHPNSSQRFTCRMHTNLTTIKHLNASNIEVLTGTCANDLGEARDTDTHQFSPRSLLSLLTTYGLVIHILHFQLQRCCVVTDNKCS